MTDDLDRIYSSDEDLIPSSGFTDAVMHAVRLEAATPAAIPFPWRRAAAGVAAAIVLLVTVAVEASRFARAGMFDEPPAWPSMSWFQAATSSQWAWPIGGLILAALMTSTAMRMGRWLGER